MMCGWIKVLLLLSCTHTTATLTCEWSRKRGYKLIPYITSGSLKIVSARSEDECKQKCVDQTSFICAAINYFYYANCQLLAENNETAREQLNRYWSYAVRPACAGLWQPWQAVKDQQPGDGVNINTTAYSSVRGCMFECLQTPSGGCRSIVMTAGNWSRCQLADKRSNDVGVNIIPSNTYQIFNRPTWYLADSPGVTRTPMEDFGTAGGALHILYNYKIPIDGYLVAWQYYIGHNNTPCTTYAVIWRREGNPYTRVTETKLTPENTQSRGVRFQYVQNTDVLVRKGDVLGFYCDGDSGCDGSLISFSNGQPSDPLALVCGGRYDRPTTLPASGGSSCSIKTRVAALRAYIAGLAMISSPTSSHDGSSSERQIKITWVQTPGSHDQTGSVYVKISCYTTSTFSSQVDCQPSIVPVEDKQAILTLPNITQPYYSRLYLVVLRNGRYQQRTGADDFHNVNNGQPFCVERRELTDDQVDFGESGQLVPGEKRRLKISIPSLAADACVSSVTVSDGTSSRAGLDKVSDWLLELEQGLTYSLTVTLQLIDGYLAIVWRHEYTTKQAPGSPKGLSLTGRSENSATFTWTSPLYTDTPIHQYQISCKAVNTTYSKNVSPNTVTLNSSVTSVIVSLLSSQVRYECAVKALVLNGYGEKSTPLVFWTKPPELFLEFPSALPAVCGEIVLLSLPDLSTQSTSAYSSMQVVVQNVPFRSKRSLTNIDVDGVQAYITAEILIGEVKDKFVVGDDESYGRYANRPLDVGSYVFYIGFRSWTEESIEYIEIPESTVTVTGSFLPEERDTGEEKKTTRNFHQIPLVIALSIALSVSIIIIVVLCVKLHRQRTASQDTLTRHGQMPGARNTGDPTNTSEYTHLTMSGEVHVYERPTNPQSTVDEAITLQDMADDGYERPITMN